MQSQNLKVFVLLSFSLLFVFSFSLFLSHYLPILLGCCLLLACFGYCFVSLTKYLKKGELRTNGDLQLSSHSERVVNVCALLFSGEEGGERGGNFRISPLIFPNLLTHTQNTPPLFISSEIHGRLKKITKNDVANINIIRYSHAHAFSHTRFFQVRIRSFYKSKY